VNLTPFAGLLSNGQQHTVAMTVENVQSQFSLTGTLLLFEDHGSQQVTGQVVLNTIKPPNPQVTTNLHVNGSNVLGTVQTTSYRQFQLAGYVNTSHGKVSTLIQQGVNFSSLMGFKITPSLYIQDISQLIPVNSTVSTSGNDSSLSTETRAYPLTLGIVVTFPNGQTIESTTVQQEFKDIVANQQYSSSVDNLVNSKDTLNFNTGVNQNANSSQQYTFGDSLNRSYSCGLTTKSNALTAVSSGCSRSIPFKQ
jgi:hypothetical protein